MKSCPPTRRNWILSVGTRSLTGFTIYPEIVLNCAALTDVDVCEESRHSYMVKKVNVEGPRNIAQASARYDCKVIQISSDQVFGGEKAVPQPYFEDDTLDPLSAYGRSKMESEIAVRENAPDYMIIRSGWLYGMEGDNFVQKPVGEYSR